MSALLLLERDEAAQVGELGVVEVRLAEPALDACRDGACLLGRPVGGGEGLGLRGELSNVVRPIASRVLTTITVGFARAAMASGSAPNRYASAPSPPGAGRRAHDDEVGLLGLAQDRVADVRAPRAGRASPLPWRCCLTNAASARSAWARTASVMPGGTRWRTTTVAPW